MKKLAIVGSHPGTRENAPFEDAEFEVWVFNEAPQAAWCRRWDATLQLHKPEVYTSPNNMSNKNHWPWLQENHGPEKTVWMQEVDPRVPNSRRYPMAEILEWMPAAKPMGEEWFTSTASMALALGLHLGYEHIEIHGVELSSGTEYAYQLPNWLYWVGVGKAMLGNNLVLKCGEKHFNDRLYGYEGAVELDEAYFQKRVEFLAAEHKTLDNEMRKCRDKIVTALLAGKYGEFPDLIVAAQESAQKAGEAAGALQEARSYAGREDPIPRQLFERRGAQAQEDGDSNRSLMDKESGKVEYVWNVLKITGNYEALKQLRIFYGKLLELAFNTGGCLGVWHENARYLVEYDARVTAAGGKKTLESLGMIKNLG